MTHHNDIYMFKNIIVPFGKIPFGGCFFDKTYKGGIKIGLKY